LKNKILIFTATYNEADNILDFLNCVEKLNLNADVLIVDDNSPDSTWKIIKTYSVDKKNINLIIRNKKDGLDTAHKLAYEYAIKNAYEYLITLDADLSHDPKIIPQFIKELETNTFVIGSRYMQGGECGMTGWRLFLSYFGNKFIRLMFKINCDEFTTFYRGFNLIKLQNFHLNSINSKGYSFAMETVFQMHKRGIKIKQIPISFKGRLKGYSKIPKIELFRTLLNIFRLKFFNRN
jgi:dolichol-phosphate mannosyltransferase